MEYDYYDEYKSSGHSESEYECNSKSADLDSDSDFTYTTKGKSSTRKKVKDDKKKVCSSQKIWSEDDEINMLQGFIEYSKQNSIKDISGFYNFFNKSINADITRKQLSDKLSRLKKKILDFESKVTTDHDKSSTFRKPHDQKVFDLSMMLWGKTSHHNSTTTPTVKESCVDTNNDQPPNSSASESEENKVSDDYDKIITLPALFDEYMRDRGLELDFFGGSRKKDLKKRWHKVKKYEHKYLALKSRLDDVMNQLLFEAQDAYSTE